MGNKVRYLDTGSMNHPLLMLHGLGGCADKWAAAASILSNHYRVIMPDMTGYGKSAKPIIDYTPEFFVSFTKEFVDTLDLKMPFIAGVSLGGQIAAKYAAESSRISKLILVSPAGMMKHPTPALDAYVMAALYPRESSAAHALKLMDGGEKEANPSIIRMFLDNMRRPNAKMAFMSTLLCFRNDKVITPILKKITVPTLLIWGYDDMIVPISYASKFTMAIEKCTFEGMTDCGHTPYAQHPQRFADAVHKFLAKY